MSTVFVCCVGCTLYSSTSLDWNLQMDGTGRDRNAGILILLSRFDLSPIPSKTVPLLWAEKRDGGIYGISKIEGIERVPSFMFV